MTEYLEKCSICGTPFKSSIFRRRHLKQEHEMSLEDYVVKTVYNGVKPKCKCGCGKDLIFAEKLKGTWYYEYVYNHSPRKQPSEETKRKMVEDRKKTNLERYGHECSAQSDIIKEKIKKTNLERYGVEHPLQNKEIYNKLKNTLKERYGIENPMQNEEFRQKAIEYNKVKYGVENPFQNEEIKEKIKKTNLERYGVERASQSDLVKQKTIQTNIERYGSKHHFDVPEIYAKVIKTNLERYGHEHPVQNSDIFEKMKKSNIEKYGVEYTTQVEEFKNKTELTNIKRYGNKSPFGNKDVQKKSKETSLERYGVEYAIQNKEILNKRDLTNIERYGSKSSFSNKQVRNKIKDTNIEKYGVDNPMKNLDIQKKVVLTNNEIYGVDYPTQNEEIKKKILKTNFIKCGYEHFLQNKEIYQKFKETSLEKYGFEHPMQSKEIYNKLKSNNLEKYGVELTFNVLSIKEQIKQTNILKYGVEYPFQMKDFRKAFNPKHSKKELEVCEKLGGEHAFNYNGKEYDIKLGNNLFEIDGDYFHTESLQYLNLPKLNSCVNDFKKIKDIENSPYKLYKIFISNLPKEITEENLIKNSYVPNFELNYEDVIVSKDYLKTIIEREGKEYLEKYLKYFLAFIKTFQPTFPYHKSNDDIENIKEIIFNYKKFDTIFNKETKVFNNSAYTVGTTYLKAMFHSYWKSSFRGNKSPVQIWESEKDMTNIIKYRIGLNNSGEIYDFSLKNLVKGISAVRGSISFFKPIVAACIYREFLKDFSQEDAPKVFDPCCGFGGRMLGFKSSFPNGIYVGCEPNVETYNELLELSKNFTNVTIYNCKVEELNEEIVNNLQNCHLSFTSIPYFDLETYSNVMEYENIEVWKETFIKSLYKFPNLLLNIPKDLENCFENVLDKYYLKNAVSKHLTKKNEEEKYEVILKFF